MVSNASLGQGNLIFFVVRAVRRIISGGSVDKIIIIIVSFRVGKFKNKNIDHRVKETCAIMSTQVTYETDHIYILCHSTMSSALLFFYVFYCDLKEKYNIRRNINCKKKKTLHVKSVLLLF